MMMAADHIDNHTDDGAWFSSFHTLIKLNHTEQWIYLFLVTYSTMDLIVQALALYLVTNMDVQHFSVVMFLLISFFLFI